MVHISSMSYRGLPCALDIVVTPNLVSCHDSSLSDQQEENKELMTMTMTMMMIMIMMMMMIIMMMMQGRRKRRKGGGVIMMMMAWNPLIRNWSVGCNIYQQIYTFDIFNS